MSLTVNSSIDYCPKGNKSLNSTLFMVLIFLVLYIFIQKALKHTNICLQDDKIDTTDAGPIPSLCKDFDKIFDDTKFKLIRIVVLQTISLLIFFLTII